MSEQLKEHVRRIRETHNQQEIWLRRVEAELGIEQVKSVPPLGLVKTDPAPAQGYSFGGEEIRPGVCRDPNKLLKPFADKVEILFQRLRAQGYEPWCWETWRSFERADLLTKKGTGVHKSMHCYGMAVDIVEHDSSPWDAPHGFWQAIEDEAKALGLFVLYDKQGKRMDLPHVQAVAVKDQERIRNMTSDAERIAFLSQSAAFPPSTSST